MRKKEISIVVGGSKGIGKAIYLVKKQNKNVFIISRALKKSKIFINLDLSNPELIEREIAIKIKKFRVKNLIFCQRYKGDDLFNHFDIGLFSSKYFIDALG